MPSVRQSSCLAVILVTFLMACAPRAYQVGSLLELPTKSLYAPSSGKIVITLNATGDEKQAYQCPGEDDLYLVRVKRGSKKLLLEQSCFDNGRRLVFTSKDSMPKGRYAYRLFGDAAKIKVYRPVYHVEYDNPDFESHDDETADLAMPLAAEQKTFFTLDPLQGDTTDWHQFDAKRGFLRIQSGAGDGDKERADILRVQLYRMLPGVKKPQPKLISSWKVGRKRTFRVSSKQAKYALRVYGASDIQKTNYWLNIKNSLGGEAGPMPVVDLYKDASGEIHVVLGKNNFPGIEVNLKMDVFLRQKRRMKYFGSCSVASLSGAVALCKMPQAESEIGPGTYLAKVAQTKRR